jgi:hypothetical protein
MAISMSAAFGSVASLRADVKTRRGARTSVVVVRASGRTAGFKNNARTKHDSYNEHHGPEYMKHAGLDTLPDERARRHAYYDKRTANVQHHFRGSIGMDDWLFRVENKLAQVRETSTDGSDRLDRSIDVARVPRSAHPSPALDDPRPRCRSIEPRRPPSSPAAIRTTRRSQTTDPRATRTANHFPLPPPPPRVSSDSPEITRSRTRTFAATRSPRR